MQPALPVRRLREGQSTAAHTRARLSRSEVVWGSMLVKTIAGWGMWPGWTTCTDTPQATLVVDAAILASKTSWTVDVVQFCNLSFGCHKTTSSIQQLICHSLCSFCGMEVAWYPAKSAPKAGDLPKCLLTRVCVQALQVCSPLHRVHPQGAFAQSTGAALLLAAFQLLLFVVAELASYQR